MLNWEVCSAQARKALLRLIKVARNLRMERLGRSTSWRCSNADGRSPATRPASRGVVCEEHRVMSLDLMAVCASDLALTVCGFEGRSVAKWQVKPLWHLLPSFAWTVCMHESLRA